MADAKATCDGGRPEFLHVALTPNLGDVDGEFTALVDAFRLSSRDAFELPLSAEVGFKVRKHAPACCMDLGCGCSGRNPV